MRISDWSSDVCSADLSQQRQRADGGAPVPHQVHIEQLEPLFVAAVFDAADERDTGVVHQRVEPARDALNFFERLLNAVTRASVGLDQDLGAARGSIERKSVVHGKHVTVRLGIGSDSIIKTKKQT